jgi:hypothetical protein
MNNIVTGLRQSPKGQLQYERKIEGKPLEVSIFVKNLIINSSFTVSVCHRV